MSNHTYTKKIGGDSNALIFVVPSRAGIRYDRLFITLWERRRFAKRKDPRRNPLWPALIWLVTWLAYNPSICILWSAPFDQNTLTWSDLIGDLWLPLYVFSNTCKNSQKKSKKIYKILEKIKEDFWWKEIFETLYFWYPVIPTRVQTRIHNSQKNLNSSK